MPRRTVPMPAESGEVLLEIWAANERMNRLILEQLDPRAWRARPPGPAGRPIAAIFAHVHNVRRKWLRLSAPHLRLPGELHRTTVTQKQAKAGLAASGQRCAAMLADALTSGAARVKTFRRDGWGRAWPAGATMAAYMLAHEAHHRGQVLMLASQLGYPLRDQAGYQIWNWDKLWKQCGFGSGPR